jgi:putative endonuclease
MEKVSYVYMMGSTSRHVLYTGVTAFFYLRVWQHKNNQGGYFTTKYRCYRLVYFEQFANVEAAIAREKEIKGWRREKKNKLIESMNPGWKDLAADWYPEGPSEGWGSSRFQQNTNIRSLRATRQLMKTLARSRLSG